jgi:hypothetical protein
MKNNTHKIGGIAGIVEAGLFLFGFLLLFTVLEPTIDESKTDIEKLTFLLEYKTIYQTWNLFIYVLFGVVLVPLTIAINENFKQPSLIGTKVTPLFGLIWSGLVIASGMIANVGIESVASIMTKNTDMALTSWKTIEAVQNGLGGGVEIVGGLWVFLISITGLKQSVFSKPLNYFGLMVGGAGILTIIPGFQTLGAVFGLTQIGWFTWLGITMLRSVGDTKRKKYE